MKDGYVQPLKIIKRGMVVFLMGILLMQYFFVEPPVRDYFNVNLNVVTAIVILFSCLLIGLAIYNYKKAIQQPIPKTTQNVDDLKESYIQIWASLSGACLISQLVYFHIYGQISLIVVSLIAMLILILLRLRYVP